MSSGNLKWYPSDELWDDYIYKELEKVEEALEVLEEDNELEDVGDRGMSKFVLFFYLQFFITVEI